LGLIADLKSGFVNIAKILGLDDTLTTEQDQTMLIDKICERFKNLETIKADSN
jgi:hypothetical protein